MKYFRKYYFFVVMLIAIPLDYFFWNVIFMEEYRDIKSIITDHRKQYKELIYNKTPSSSQV